MSERIPIEGSSIVRIHSEMILSLPSTAKHLKVTGESSSPTLYHTIFLPFTFFFFAFTGRIDHVIVNTLRCDCDSLLSSYRAIHVWTLMEKQAMMFWLIVFFTTHTDLTFHLNIFLNIWLIIILHYFTFQSIHPLHFASVHQFSYLPRLIFQSFIISSLAS